MCCNIITRSLFISLQWSSYCERVCWISPRQQVSTFITGTLKYSIYLLCFMYIYYWAGLYMYVVTKLNVLFPSHIPTLVSLFIFYTTHLSWSYCFNFDVKYVTCSSSYNFREDFSSHSLVWSSSPYSSLLSL